MNEQNNTTSQKIITYAFFSIFLIVGLILLIWGVTMTKSKNAKKLYYQKTDGEVVEVIRHRHDDSSDTYSARYRFVVDGVEYYCEDEVSTAKKPRIGSSAVILYNPSNPGAAFPEGGTSNGSVLVLIGGLFSIAALLFMMGDSKGFVAEIIQGFLVSFLFMGMGFGMAFGLNLGFSIITVFLFLFGAIGVFAFVMNVRRIFVPDAPPVVTFVPQNTQTPPPASGQKPADFGQEPIDFNPDSPDFGQSAEAFESNPTGFVRSESDYGYYNESPMQGTPGYNNYSSNILAEGIQNTIDTVQDTVQDLYDQNRDAIDSTVHVVKRGSDIVSGVVGIIAGVIFMGAALLFLYAALQPNVTADVPMAFILVFIAIFFALGLSSVVRGFRLLRGQGK